MGFEELPHTADLAMRVWAEDLPGLFVQAARGMNALAGVRLAQQGGVKKYFKAKGPDVESLLVAFLSELIYYLEQENLGSSEYDIRIRDSLLKADLQCKPVQSIDKVIKAVTFHNLKIRKTAAGYETELVFDV